MEKIGKISAIVISVIVVVSGLASTTVAYDSNNPWTGTVKWSIPADTSFTVTFAGSQTQINFTASGKSDTLIEPNGQDAASKTPIITIENTGNIDLQFGLNLTSSKPTWATIKGLITTPTATADHTYATEFDTTVIWWFSAGNAISAGESASMYLWSNVTEAPAGDTTRELMLHSNAV